MDTPGWLICTVLHVLNPADSHLVKCKVLNSSGGAPPISVGGALLQLTTHSGRLKQPKQENRLTIC